MTRIYFYCFQVRVVHRRIQLRLKHLCPFRAIIYQHWKSHLISSKAHSFLRYINFPSIFFNKIIALHQLFQILTLSTTHVADLKIIKSNNVIFTFVFLLYGFSGIKCTTLFLLVSFKQQVLLTHPLSTIY